jgi:diguanylate cyclase (GGDEF)-like protein/PAS domain S-box-containing protein
MLYWGNFSRKSVKIQRELVMSDLNTIEQWRLRVFTSLMSIVRIVAFILAVPSAAFGLIYGIVELTVLSAGALAWVLAICRFSHFPYTARVLNFLALVFVVAIGTMVIIGPVGICYLMAGPVFATILLGLRPALWTLSISAACMVSLGLTGYCSLPITNFADESIASNALFTLIFTGVGAIITFTCNTLIEGVSNSLDNVNTFAQSLEERQNVLNALNKKLRLTSAALAGLNEMVIIIKAVKGQKTVQPIIFANETFERCSGYRTDEIIGCSMRMFQGSETDSLVVAKIADAMTHCEAVSEELIYYTKSGTPCWVEMNVIPFSSEGADITHWVISGRDITERRRSADAIHQLAFFDVLTGLPNRRLLMERLDVMVAEVCAGKGLGAILYIDLDNFKHVNDARGHATGDALLRHIASCLSRAVHTHDTVARLGGDEFVVLLQDLGLDSGVATAAAKSAAERVRSALMQGVHIDGQLYHSSGSIGIALPTGPQPSVHDLLREADIAMYHAKSAGRNGVALFETTMFDEAENTLTLQRDLANALANDELALHLQLQVDNCGRPVGAEVLLRWRREDGILVPPDVFIPVAESTGLIVEIGLWVLQQACVVWHQLEQTGHALPISINVSPRQFQEAAFVKNVIAVVMDSGVPPSQLIFEITEGLLVADLEKIVSRMRELADFGIRFSIDDFGTGYSNLAYLRQMPLYELKIDKSFMRDMPHDVNSKAIVRSILSMAEHLNLRVMAEGVENSEQADFLTEHGGLFMQGYLFGRPMPIFDLLKKLAAHRTPIMSGSSGKIEN